MRLHYLEGTSNLITRRLTFALDKHKCKFTSLDFVDNNAGEQNIRSIAFSSIETHLYFPSSILLFV